MPAAQPAWSDAGSRGRSSDSCRWGSPFNRSSAGQGHATNNRTNGHFGAVTSANVGYLPPAGPLRWRAPIRLSLGGELRPVVRRRLVEVQLTALRELVRGRRRGGPRG